MRHATAGDNLAEAYRVSPVPALPGDGPRVRYLVFPPEMGDGRACSIVSPEDIDAFVADALRLWLEEATEGETLEIGFREMSAGEFAALPEL